jgi:hypothetical protein
MDPISIGLMAASAIGNIFSGFGAKKRERKAANQQREYENQLRNLEANRQAIVDPYSGVRDLSSMVSNPFANLQVATGAAEMQARETDISLASTLDAIRASGGGSATALAQAASRSKQDIAASIEQQEAENARLRAQGEQQMQQMQMQEAIRMQEADISGKQFTFGIREQREGEKLDRLQGLTDRYASQAAMAQEAKASAFGSAFSSMAGLGAGLASG